MKLLYIAPLPIDFENLNGVPKKILCQANAMQCEFDVEILYYFDGKVRLYSVKNKREKLLGEATSKLSVLKTATKLVKARKYVGSYVRYPRSDYFFISMLKSFKKAEMRIVVEIPTYPYDKEGFETFKGRIINYLDRSFRGFLHKYVDRIVTYSDDKVIFKIPTINTINGIDFSKVEFDKSAIDINDSVDLIAVSAMFRVHGYERLIEGLNDYYCSGGARNIKLKLVGKGDECAKYENLVNQYKLSEHVIFYGAQFGDALQKLYIGNAVGVNSLAIHRQGLIKESTLKTKEYAAKGLPVISSSYVDAFSAEGNEEYVYRVAPDESNISINELLTFVDKIYSKPTELVRESIRNDGSKVCDIAITMKPVIQFLKS